MFVYCNASGMTVTEELIHLLGCYSLGNNLRELGLGEVSWMVFLGIRPILDCTYSINNFLCMMEFTLSRLILLL